MNEALCLRTLGTVMDWSDDRARIEYEWLRLMSRFKYDGYRDFVAGFQFLESLITWLMQFETSQERQIAYSFVKNRLVYFGPAEITKLVNLCYFDKIRPMVVEIAAKDLSIETHCLWSHPGGAEHFAHCLRHVLFMGLSDGARTDLLRYAARGELTNEQVVSFTQIDPEKWQDLLDDLRKDTKNADARFRCLFVIDDFTASGTSLLRKPKHATTWKGKLVKLWKSLEHARNKLDIDPMEENWKLCVHHYLATKRAEIAIYERESQAAAELSACWFDDIEFSFSYVLDSSFEISDESDTEFLVLADKYYDSTIESERHLKECEIDNLKRGYAGCSLPLILEHNTPNNSLALLWAESFSDNGISMRPLFRRHQRHD